MDGQEREVYFVPLKNELEWEGKDLNMSQILNLADLISQRKSLRSTIQGQRVEKKKARKQLVKVRQTHTYIFLCMKYHF